MRIHQIAGIAAGLATGLLALACGGSDLEQELVQANEAVEAARTDVEKARGTVETRQGEVAEAQQKLADARSDLREAEAELTRREAAVNVSATDTVLFRAVQKRLLEDEKLSDVAIAATVSNGVVVLNGNVANGKLRDRAVDVTRKTPGVTQVESLIEVQVGAGPPES